MAPSQKLTASSKGRVNSKNTKRPSLEKWAILPIIVPQPSVDCTVDFFPGILLALRGLGEKEASFKRSWSVLLLVTLHLVSDLLLHGGTVLAVADLPSSNVFRIDCRQGTRSTLVSFFQGVVTCRKGRSRH